MDFIFFDFNYLILKYLKKKNLISRACFYFCGVFHFNYVLIVSTKEEILSRSLVDVIRLDNNLVEAASTNTEFDIQLMVKQKCSETVSQSKNHQTINYSCK